MTPKNFWARLNPYRYAWLVVLAGLVAQAPCFGQALPLGDPTQRQNDTTPNQSSEPLVQELFLSEVPINQESGEIQTTLAATIAEWRQDRLFRTHFLAEYGITNRLQLDAEFPFQRTAAPGEPVQHGFQEVEFGAQYAFAHDVNHLLVTGALRMSLLNSSKEDPDAPMVQVEPAIMFGRRIGSFQLHWGASAPLRGEHKVNFATAIIYPWAKWRGTLEFLTNSGGERDSQLAPGLICQFRGLEFGLATPLRLEGNTPAVTLMFVVTREFGGKRE